MSKTKSNQADRRKNTSETDERNKETTRSNEENGLMQTNCLKEEMVVMKSEETDRQICVNY